MSYQSLIGKPNEWGDDKATVMTIRNPGYDLGCPPGHCSRRMKEGELHYQRSDTRYQPACSFVFCLGCFEILWGKQFLPGFEMKKIAGKTVTFNELAPFLNMIGIRESGSFLSVSIVSSRL